MPEKIKKNVILLGDGAVGKTSLIKRFVLDQFDDKYITTIGTKVTKKELFVGSQENGADMTLLVWDILGQKGYKYTQALSFGGIEGALLVADLTRPETLESLKEYWIPSIISVTGPIPMAFIGNKADLEDERTFGLKELEAAASQFKTSTFTPQAFLTSARTGDFVDDAFYKLAKVMKDTTIIARDKIPQSFIDKSEVHTLVDVVDHIVADFSNHFGGLENATPVVRHQMERVGLDLENPNYKAVVEFINNLAHVENDIKSPEEVKMNRTKRLYLVNNLSK